MLQAIGLTKKYGDHLAIDHVSFKLEPGNVYGLLGKNGAGKTTTMNIITGYIAATSGNVIIQGKSLFDDPKEAKRHIGYLPEIPPLYEDMTVLEYLRFVAELKQIPVTERKKQIEEVMEITKVGHMSFRLIGNLSKGYRQRVGLAYAILGFPEIIILDEPTVGIDPKQLEDVRELIRTLSGRHTIVFSSHILSEAETLCDHAIILNNGCVAAMGTIRELAVQAGAGNRVKIRAAGTEEITKSILSACTFVRSFQTKAGQGKETLAELTMPADNAALAALFQAFSDRGTPLLEIRPEEYTMEDLFMQFTEDTRSEAGK